MANHSPTETTPVSAGKRMARALALACVVCGDAPMFRGLADMHERCDRCGYFYAREGGYWLGAMYVNYGAAVVLAVTAHIVMADVYAVPTFWQLVTLVPFSALFVIWFFRYSRALWLAIDLTFDPPKHTDFHHESEHHRP